MWASRTALRFPSMRSPTRWLRRQNRPRAEAPVHPARESHGISLDGLAIGALGGPRRSIFLFHLAARKTVSGSPNSLFLISTSPQCSEPRFPKYMSTACSYTRNPSYLLEIFAKSILFSPTTEPGRRGWRRLRGSPNPTLYFFLRVSPLSRI